MGKYGYRVIDGDGHDAEPEEMWARFVLFATVTMGPSSGVLPSGDVEFEAALCRAYNSWVAEYRPRGAPFFAMILLDGGRVDARGRRAPRGPGLVALGRRVRVLTSVRRLGQATRRR